MAKKIYMFFLTVFCIIGIAFLAQRQLRADRRGPEIHLPETDVTYREGEDDSVLLEGVTAVDDRDGDVTASLLIEDIYILRDEGAAKVVYVALDSSNNVTKVQRVVSFEAKEPQPQSSEKAETDTDADAESEDDKTLPASSVQECTLEETTVAELERDNVRVAVINGSGVAGAAAEWQDKLKEGGFENITVGSTTARVEVTTVYSDQPELLTAMTEYFPNALTSAGMPAENTEVQLDEMDVCIVLGVQ